MSPKRYKINAKKLGTVARFICRELGLPSHEVAITLVESAEIKRLNKKFRKKNQGTDVLSFPQMAWDKPRRVGDRVIKLRRGAPPESLGDVVISIPEAQANAVGIGQPLDRELAFLLVHGTLHLCGHNHEIPVDERRMLTQQRKLMKLMTVRSAGPLWKHCIRELGA